MTIIRFNQYDDVIKVCIYVRRLKFLKNEELEHIYWKNYYDAISKVTELWACKFFELGALKTITF